MAAIVLPAIVALALSACGGDDDSDGTNATAGDNAGEGAGSAKGSEIAFITLGNGNVYNDGVLKGIKEAAAEAGVSVTPLDGAFSPEKQLSACQQVTSLGKSKYQAIIMIPVTNAAGVPCAPLAKNAGIPLISVGNVVGDSVTSTQPTVDGVTAQVAIPMQTSIDGLVDMAVSACEGKDPCNVGWFRTTSTLSDADARMAQTLEAAIKANPNMRLAAQADTPLDVQGAANVTNNFLQKEPNLNVLVSYISQNSAGSTTAIKQAGKTTENSDGIRLVFYGCTTDMIEKMREDQAYGCVPILPVTEGKTAIKYAVEAIEGGSPPSSTPIKEAGLPVKLSVDNLAEYPEFTGEWTN